MASASHDTGHGVAVGRGRSGNRLSCVGRFFRFRPLLSELELQQAFTLLILELSGALSVSAVAS